MVRWLFLEINGLDQRDSPGADFRHRAVSERLIVLHRQRGSLPGGQARVQAFVRQRLDGEPRAVRCPYESE